MTTQARNLVKNGKWKEFNRHAVLIAEGVYVNGRKHGKWREYYDESGSIMIEEHYCHGVKDGCYTSFHPNGQVFSEGQFFNGKREGVFNVYDDQGNNTRNLFFVNNIQLENSGEHAKERAEQRKTGSGLPRDLRAAAVPDQRGAASGVVKPPSEPDPMKKKLLIVDSDRHLNIVNEKVLRTAGIVTDLHIASNGQDALDYLQAHAGHHAALPDIIVFDLQMPVVNGFDFIDQFAQLQIPGKDHVELVVFTASARPSDRQKAISKGIRHFLDKPYLLGGLRSILSQLNVKPVPEVGQIGIRH